MVLGGHVVLVPLIESTVVNPHILYGKRWGIVVFYADNLRDEYSYLLNSFPEFLCYLCLYNLFIYYINWILRYCHRVYLYLVFSYRVMRKVKY